MLLQCTSDSYRLQKTLQSFLALFVESTFFRMDLDKVHKTNNERAWHYFFSGQEQITAMLDFILEKQAMVKVLYSKVDLQTMLKAGKWQSGEHVYNSTCKTYVPKMIPYTIHQASK